MNKGKLYQWMAEVTSQLNGLNRWQQDNIALFSYGMAAACSCQEWTIASYLSEHGQVASLRRRLQRFVSSSALQLQMSSFFREWSGWVASGYSGETVWLVVDEAKLHDRLGAMVVGLVYERRYIPLALYVANSPTAYPAEGQVEVIRQLLLAVREGLPEER